MSKERKMKILICTGIYPPDVGGPAQYAKNLKEEFERKKHNVKVLVYKFERKIPIGFRHLLYFVRVLINIKSTDLIIALDTFSVGLPSILAGKITGKKTVLRVGGDYLWESYVNRSADLISIPDFYKKLPKLSIKERIIKFFTFLVLNNSYAIAFNTSWQAGIFKKAYNMENNRVFIIENFYGKKEKTEQYKEKNYIYAGRPIKIKNIDKLKDAFSEAFLQNREIKLDIISDTLYKETLEKIKRCYAVVLPSLSDVSPNLIADTIRFNKPFILTQECGLVEKFKDIGIFIDPYSKEDIKNKILYLANDYNYKIYQEKISNFNFTHSWEEIALEFLQIYKIT